MKDGYTPTQLVADRLMTALRNDLATLDRTGNFNGEHYSSTDAKAIRKAIVIKHNNQLTMSRLDGTELE